MSSNDTFQSHKARVSNLSQRKKQVVVNKNKSPVPAQSPNYRFVWIEPDVSNVPKMEGYVSQSLGSCVMVRDINPVFEYNCSSRDNSSKYSLMDYYNDSGERYNFSTTSLQYHSSTDNLLPKNKSYTAIVKNENVSEKNNCSLSQNSKQDLDFEKVQSKKLSEDDLILDCTESDDIMGNETIAKNNMESEIDICENDDTFEIAVLNDKQLEIKKIII